MRSDLAEGSAFHMLMNPFPVFPIFLKKSLKKISLGRCPPSTPFLLGRSTNTLLSLRIILHFDVSFHCTYFNIDLIYDNHKYNITC